MSEIKLEQKHIDSREVAEMVGKNHKIFLADSRKYISQLAELKIQPSDLEIESMIIPAFSEFYKQFYKKIEERNQNKGKS